MIMDNFCLTSSYLYGLPATDAEEPSVSISCPVKWVNPGQYENTSPNLTERFLKFILLNLTKTARTKKPGYFSKEKPVPATGFFKSVFHKSIKLKKRRKNDKTYLFIYRYAFIFAKSTYIRYSDRSIYKNCAFWQNYIAR